MQAADVEEQVGDNAVIALIEQAYELDRVEQQLPDHDC
jgi:hypothetical protein